MGGGLESAGLKIDRANHHANALKATMLKWLEDRPYELSLDGDDKTGELVARIHINRQPPPEWSILLGEIVYGLRSALDHAVYALSTPAGGQPPNGTEFPIFKDEPLFRNQNRPGGLWKARGLSPAALTVVEEIQPFHASGKSEGHPLWVLHELCNIDKHRSLNLTNTALGASKLTVTPSGGVTLRASQITADGPVQDGTELARWAVDVASKGKIELDGEIGIDVAFDEAGPAKGEIVRHGLDLLGNSVKSIVARLRDTAP